MNDILISDNMYNNKIGIVIGNNYPNSDKELKFAVADAEKIKEILENKDICGFVVKYFPDKTKREVEKEIEKTLRYADNDLIFIYYSGHGKKNHEGKLCLLFNETEEDYLGATSLAFDSINSYINYPSLKTVVIVLDCCYSGAAGTRDGDADVTDDLENLSKNRSGKGTVILTSTSSTGSSKAREDEKLGHGIFTYYLIEGMEKGSAANSDGIVSIDDLYNYASNKTTERTTRMNCSQFPKMIGEKEGTIPIGKDPQKVKNYEYELKKKKFENKFSDKFSEKEFTKCQLIMIKSYDNPSSLNRDENITLGYINSLLTENNSPKDCDYLIQLCKDSVKQSKGDCISGEQRKLKEDEDNKKQQDELRRQNEEAGRKQKEEYERKQKEEAERKQREEAEKLETKKKQREIEVTKKIEEIEKIIWISPGTKREILEEIRSGVEDPKELRRLRVEVAKKMEEAERKKREEAERKLKEEQERKKREEAERKLKEEQERKKKEEAERKLREEAVKKQETSQFSSFSLPGIDKSEQERKKREEAEKLEAKIKIREMEISKKLEEIEKTIWISPILKREILQEAIKGDEEPKELRKLIEEVKSKKSEEDEKEIREKQEEHEIMLRLKEALGNINIPINYTNSIGIEFVLIPPGQYLMGSRNKSSVFSELKNLTNLKLGEVFVQGKPVHSVTIKYPFYLGKYPVTQKQWSVLMDNTSSFKGNDRPVENISWKDAQDFIKELNEMEKSHSYRLPTESEWEYACRASTETIYFFGDDESKLEDYAWYDKNSNGQTHPVGLKKPNPWGLYDMYGNVLECVQDKWYNDYLPAPDNGKALDGIWAGLSFHRVVRGGCWINNAESCCSAVRNYITSGFHSNRLGFRLVKDV